MKPVIEVDARWLDPPEPMEKAMDAIGRMEPGQRIRFLIHREPLPLYNLLRQMGLTHRTRPIGDHCYAVMIFEAGNGDGDETTP